MIDHLIDTVTLFNQSLREVCIRTFRLRNLTIDLLQHSAVIFNTPCIHNIHIHLCIYIFFNGKGNVLGTDLSGGCGLEGGKKESGMMMVMMMIVNASLSGSRSRGSSPNDRKKRTLPYPDSSSRVARGVREYSSLLTNHNFPCLNKQWEKRTTSLVFFALHQRYSKHFG